MNILTAIAISILIFVHGDEGSISKYDPGVMDRSIAWRVENNVPHDFVSKLDENYDGYIALLDCADVGKSINLHLTVNSEKRRDPLYLLVTDCTENLDTMIWMVNNKIVGELDHDTYVNNGLVVGEGAWGKVEILD